MKALWLFILVLLAAIGPAPVLAADPVTVGSKKFTESVILGDVVAGLLEASGFDARHRRELGGSRVPILRNTYTGLTGIPNSLLESADALGLPSAARLRRVDLPLAATSIMASIKTAAVINIGTATLGALIGAGGYGQPILTGIRLDDTALILEGAIPAALLALIAQALLDGAEHWLGACPRTGRRLGTDQILLICFTDCRISEEKIGQD